MAVNSDGLLLMIPVPSGTDVAGGVVVSGLLKELPGVVEVREEKVG